jgi:hypothetical protein
MKNLIAISAVALTAASANAAIVAETNQANWTNGFQTTYVNSTFYVDTLGNATVGGGGASVTGGHGWGVYTLTAVATTSTFSLTGTGSGTSIVATPTPPTNENIINFAFANNTWGAPNTGLMAIGIYFTVTNILADGSAPNVTATFSVGSGAVSGTANFTTGNNFVGFYSTANELVSQVQLQFGNTGGTGAIITITDIELGLVPAPGAIALVGVAGLVGSRRRRA